MPLSTKEKRTLTKLASKSVDIKHITNRIEDKTGAKPMYIGLEASYKKHIEYVPYNQGGLKFIFFIFRFLSRETKHAIIQETFKRYSK